MPSLDAAARDYGHVSLDDEDLIVVHMLLYGFDRRAPSVADAKEWAEHFGLEERDNHVVLVGDPRLIGSESFRRIPGLQLVDRDFVLRYDAAGNQAPDDMWSDLWPAVGVLLDESALCPGSLPMPREDASTPGVGPRVMANPTTLRPGRPCAAAARDAGKGPR